MSKILKILILSLIFYSSYHVSASDFDETLITIETRKTAMQGIWERVKRLSPYVELKEKVDYNKDLAANDAQEIVQLLEKTKYLWSEKSNLSPKGFTNATPAVWALPNYFNKLYKWTYQYFPLKNYGEQNYSLWMVGSDRRVEFKETYSYGNAGLKSRKENYHHPRMLMLFMKFCKAKISSSINDE